MLNLGVIGAGYWGPNHIRIFSQTQNSKVLMCADLNHDRLNLIQGIYPHVKMTTDYKDILRNSELHAVCIAAPTNLHYQLTKEALEAGKHVLCEKPLALKAGECEELKRLAKSKNKILLVGHVFIFNAGVKLLKDSIASVERGKIHYAYSIRTNLGPFRYDVNALWDLAPHDISIFN